MKGIILVLREALTRQKPNINFDKEKTKFYCSLHSNDNDNNSYCFVKKIYKFKASHNNINFPTQFCLGNISDKFGYVEAEEVSLKIDVCHFSIDYDVIDKSDILNIHNYLMIKNSMK